MSFQRAYLGPIVAFCFAICAGPAGAQSTVTVQGGALSGVTDARITSFKGIPYAAPPVGPLRWMPPQQPARWQGVRVADKTGPACLQPTTATGATNFSEDCLYLNVWRPADVNAGAKLPVMVWIHGGSFVIGSGSSAIYDGANLARNGVIIVSINYRLGRFGWFAYPELTKEAGPTGTANFGVMDQIAAVKWVKANIGAFGGDANNVTVFGESAGAMSINILMSSPQARGLFAKAITESGLGRVEAIPLAAAEERGTNFATAAGASNLAALRALPASTVLNSGARGEQYLPILDGTILPADVDRTFGAGNESKIPWIVGTNDFEASLFAARLTNPDAVIAAVPEAARAQVSALYDPSGTNKTAVAAGLITDKYFTEPARFLATNLAKSGEPVYRYFFSYVAEQARSRVMGAGHGSEIPFVFGNLTNRAAMMYTDSDKQIASTMGKYWTNFAKTGNPNGPGLTVWPADKGDQVLLIDATGEHPASAFRKTQLDLIQRQAGMP
jgi:para-nitrobenzyl esterase